MFLFFANENDFAWSNNIIYGMNIFILKNFVH